MATWTNSAISRKVHTNWGGQRAVIYTITGANGDTGGTLTVPFSNIETAEAIGYTAVAGLSDVAVRIDGNTVVVTYADPLAAHTVKVTVVQG